MCRDPLRKVTLTVSIILVAALACGNAAAITISPAPGREYVSQTWVGFSTDDLYTIRINLSADGTGSGVLLSSTAVAEPFEVTSWNLDSWSLVLAVHFRNREGSPSQVAGSFKQYLLSYNAGTLPHPERLSANDLPGPLELSLEDGNNHIRFGAWPEHELEERLHLVKDASTSATRADH